jgi:molybdopterin-biosynthesis enzyme MoeA-like protein
MNFYTCIIGTELLNGRRKDEHFEFVNSELLKRGWDQKASLVIKDEPYFIESTFQFIKNDPKSVMFCFGGIGATPDDYTRECAAKAFTNGQMCEHPEAAKIIIDRFGENSYPNRIKMAYLPAGASLLNNIVNKIPGFYLENRFFFVPGFPSMAHSMVVEALDKFYPANSPKFSRTFTAFCSEENLIDIMQTIPTAVEFSSLPIIDGDKRAVELYLASQNSCLTEDCYEHFATLIEKKGVQWRDGGYFDTVKQ